jgi:hypothetical protein
MGEQETARIMWCFAEAYLQHIENPWFREKYIELLNIRNWLHIVPEEVSAASEAIWGKPEEATTVFVRPPELKLQPEYFVEPFYLRSGPATVGELRAFCKEKNVQLPWYYRIHYPAAGDSEPARFVPFALARKLGEWIDEELPDSVQWKGLPESPAWKVPPRSAPFNIPPANIRIKDWEASVPAHCLIQKVILNDLKGVNLESAVKVLRSDSISPIDKWRLLTALRDKGFARLSESVQNLVKVATKHLYAGLLSSDILARLSLDWKSVAFLAGISDAPACGLWLRPEFIDKPKELIRLYGMGAIGQIAYTEASSSILMVPDSFSYADILVWPGRMLDDHIYKEGTPAWP